jgi:ATP-dependent RNA helicase MRH4, mitochondrial
MVPTTVKYRKPGVQPPVFVAGSFTNPEWVPREMNWVIDERGENLFTADIEVEPGRDYQYKFKVGYANEWDLDDQSPISKFACSFVRELWCY